LGKDRKPLMPCSPARARMLLKSGRAAILRQYPFTIILKDREGGEVQPLALKEDPGSENTGMSLVAQCERRGLTVEGWRDAPDKPGWWVWFGGDGPIPIAGIIYLSERLVSSIWIPHARWLRIPDLPIPT